MRTHFASKTNVPADNFEGFMQMVVDQAPLGREGTAQDMANATVFLANDDSSYI